MYFVIYKVHGKAKQSFFDNYILVKFSHVADTCLLSLSYFKSLETCNISIWQCSEIQLCYVETWLSWHCYTPCSNAYIFMKFEYLAYFRSTSQTRLMIHLLQTVYIHKHSSSVHFGFSIQTKTSLSGWTKKWNMLAPPYCCFLCHEDITQNVCSRYERYAEREWKWWK